MGNDNKHGNLIAIVSAFVAEHGRGMETFRLQAQGVSKAQIAEAIEDGALESRRGRTGGIYVAGQVPETQPTSTLKGEAFAFLRSLLEEDAEIDMAVVEDLIARYDAECEKRSEAKRKSDD